MVATGSVNTTEPEAAPRRPRRSPIKWWRENVGAARTSFILAVWGGILGAVWGDSKAAPLRSVFGSIAGVLIGAFARPIVLRGYAMVRKTVQTARWELPRLHPGQLILLWFAAAVAEAAIAATFAIDLRTPNQTTLMLGKYLFRVQGGNLPDLKRLRNDGVLNDGADALLFHLSAVTFLADSALTRIIVLICIPVCMFAVTWLWFGRRRAS